MAILGRRQPHAPIILKLGAPASVARMVTPRGQAASLHAALFSHRPLFKTLVNQLIRYQPPPSTAPTASSAIVRGAFASQLAVQRAYRPIFQPILKRLGALPVSSARIVTPRGQGTALAGARPFRSFRPIIRRTGGLASLTKIVRAHGQSASRAAADAAHRLPFKITINRLEQFQVVTGPPIASPPIVRAFASQAAAQRAYRPIFQPILKRAGTPPSVAQAISPRGQFAVQAANANAHRLVFKPVVSRLFAYQAATPGPIAAKPMVDGEFASIAASNRLYHPIFQPILNRLGASAPIAQLLSPRSQFAAQAAANTAHRLPFRTFLGTLFQYQPPPPQPIAAASPIVRTYASIATATRLYRPSFSPILKWLGPLPATARIVVARGQSASARTATDRYYRPFTPATFKRLGAPPAIGQIATPRGQGPALAAALVSQRSCNSRAFSRVLVSSSGSGFSASACNFIVPDRQTVFVVPDRQTVFVVPDRP